jgi:chitinase
MTRRNWGVPAILLALAAPTLAHAAPGDPPGAKVFVGYVFGTSRDVNFKLYTHLCQAFLTADADGNLRNGERFPDRELVARAHRDGVKVLVSLGGWGWDEQFAAMTARPEAEDRYVGAVLALADRFDYDGLDLDWEYPDTKEEVAGFERLARRLRRGLDAIGTREGRPMVLTMAAGANPGTLRWLDTAFLLETLDWVNVMTYDYAGDWTPYAGHNAPLFASTRVPGGRSPSVAATIDYLLTERRFPADRLALGLPLYGRGFPVKEPYASTKGVPKARLPRGDYRNLARLLGEEGWTRRRDDETKVPWLIAPDGSAVFGYDDAESLATKTDWAMGRGLRGVFFWQVAADRLDDGSHPLQEAARREWEEAGPAGGRPR